MVRINLIPRTLQVPGNEASIAISIATCISSNSIPISNNCRIQAVVGLKPSYSDVNYLSAPPPPPAPEGVPAPLVTNGIGTTVLVSWAMPTLPNGVILEYRVERGISGDDNFTTVGVLGGNVSRVVVDIRTQPFITYEYQIVAVNSAGSATGPSTSFTTPEAGNITSFPDPIQPLECLGLRIFHHSKCMYVCVPPDNYTPLYPQSHVQVLSMGVRLTTVSIVCVLHSFFPLSFLVLPTTSLSPSSLPPSFLPSFPPPSSISSGQDWSPAERTTPLVSGLMRIQRLMLTLLPHFWSKQVHLRMFHLRTFHLLT